MRPASSRRDTQNRHRNDSQTYRPAHEVTPLGWSTILRVAVSPYKWRNLSVYPLNFFALCARNEPATLDIMANAQRASPARHPVPKSLLPPSHRPCSDAMSDTHRFRKINFGGTNLPVVVCLPQTTIGGIDSPFPGNPISAPLTQSHISKLCKQGGGTVCDEFWHY